MVQSDAKARSGIFLSYRRDDAFAANWLAKRLIKSFGRDQVFVDVESIPAGENFPKAIRSAVQSCDVLLAVIGPQWVDATNEKGIRRLDDPADFVRLEIEAALNRRIRVIPVLIGNTTEMSVGREHLVRRLASPTA